MSKKLIPDSKVASERYRCSLRTLARWDDDVTLGFPPPIRIRSRKYRDEEQLDAFDARQAQQGKAA